MMDWIRQTGVPGMIGFSIGFLFAGVCYVIDLMRFKDWALAEIAKAEAEITKRCGEPKP